MLYTPRKQGGSTFSPAGNVFTGLISRELYGARHEIKRPFIGDFSADGGVSSGVLRVAKPETLERLPPFCVRFCERIRGGKLLAVADEEGYVTIHDVNRQLPSNDDSTPYEPAQQWLAHQNAIFDVCWSNDDSYILSGSGDQTIGVWDWERHARVRTLKGHKGSVKSVAASRSSPGLFASGSRDGTVRIWDLSASGRAAQEAAAGAGASGSGSTMLAAGPSELELAPIGTAESPNPPAGKSKAGKTANSVTGVVFLAGDRLVASSNASESAVKIWDRRNLDRPLALLNRTGLARPRGVTSLTLDPSEGSDRLAASYSDSVVCVWRASSAAADGEPEACLKGHKSSSFYVKIAFSPDGTHIASGSCDYGLYVWQIARPADPPFVLRGHGREVDGVDWCRTDFGCLASCGDDSTVRVWAIRRPADTARALLCAAARAPARRCLCDLPRESHAAAVSGVVSYARLYLTTSR